MCSCSDVKRWLESYQQILLEVEEQEYRIIDLQRQLKGVGAQNISDMPKSPSPSNDRWTNLIYKKQLVEKSIEDLTERGKQTHDQIEMLLSMIEKTDEKTLIRRRFLDGLDANDLVFCLFGRKSDFSKREESYVRRMYRIQNDAIRNITEIVNSDPELEGRINRRSW